MIVFLEISAMSSVTVDHLALEYQSQIPQYLVWSRSTYYLTIWTLLNMSKSTSYSDLLTYVGLKTLEHRRYSHTVLTFVYFLFFTFTPLYFFILFISLYCYFFSGFDMYWVYSNLARSRLNESCTHPCNVDK